MALSLANITLSASASAAYISPENRVIIAQNSSQSPITSNQIEAARIQQQQMREQQNNRANSRAIGRTPDAPTFTPPINNQKQPPQPAVSNATPSFDYNPSSPANSMPQPGSQSASSLAALIADQPFHPEIDDEMLIISTGPVAGIYFPAGGGICRLMNRERKTLGLRCAIESTPGSIYNVDLLKRQDSDFALVQSDWQEHAFTGTSLFLSKGRFDKLRHVFALHDEAFTVAVPKESNIIKFDDLRGKIVNVGPVGSGARTTMDDIMRAKGWSKSDFKSLSELKQSEQAKALCNGTIDAAIISTGHPSGAIQDITSSCETRFIPVNDQIIQKLIAGNPEFSATVIKGGTYPGIPNDVATFGVKATLVTSSEVSDDIVYNLTKTVFENLTAFKSLHPVFATLDAKKMANEGRTAPYHTGAKRYFQEHDLLDEADETTAQQ